MAERPAGGIELRIKVRYFASIRECAGVSTEQIELREGATVENVIIEAKRLHPKLDAKDGTVFVSVNGDFVDLTRRLESSDDVALFPPVSGG
jgi:molybdopterin converting factor subunit 1